MFEIRSGQVEAGRSLGIADQSVESIQWIPGQWKNLLKIKKKKKKRMACEEWKARLYSAFHMCMHARTHAHLHLWTHTDIKDTRHKVAPLCKNVTQGSRRGQEPRHTPDLCLDPDLLSLWAINVFRLNHPLYSIPGVAAQAGWDKKASTAQAFTFIRATQNTQKWHCC